MVLKSLLAIVLGKVTIVSNDFQILINNDFAIVANNDRKQSEHC